MPQHKPMQRKTKPDIVIEIPTDFDQSDGPEPYQVWREVMTRVDWALGACLRIYLLDDDSEATNSEPDEIRVSVEKWTHAEIMEYSPGEKPMGYIPSVEFGWQDKIYGWVVYSTYPDEGPVPVYRDAFGGLAFYQ